MRTVMLFIAILFVAFSVSCGAAGTDGVISDASRQVSQSEFGDSWDAHCAACNFTKNDLVTANTTLGYMYYGSHFAFDIARMDVFISNDLGEPSGLAGAAPTASYVFYDSEGDYLD